MRLDSHSTQARNRIEELVVPQSGCSFSGNDFRDLCKPCVYLFMKEGLPIYVGMSRNGIGRPSARNHHKAATARAECDQVLVYVCRSIDAAYELESILIGKTSPKHNQAKLTTNVAQLLGIKQVAVDYV